MSRIRGIALLGVVLSAVSTAFAGGGLSLSAGPPDPVLERALATANRSIVGASALPPRRAPFDPSLIFRGPGDTERCYFPIQTMIGTCAGWPMGYPSPIEELVNRCPSTLGSNGIYLCRWDEDCGTKGIFHDLCFSVEIPCFAICDPYGPCQNACYACCVDTNNTYLAAWQSLCDELEIDLVQECCQWYRDATENGTIDPEIGIDWCSALAGRLSYVVASYGWEFSQIADDYQVAIAWCQYN